MNIITVSKSFDDRRCRERACKLKKDEKQAKPRTGTGAEEVTEETSSYLRYHFQLLFEPKAKISHKGLTRRSCKQQGRASFYTWAAMKIFPNAPRCSKSARRNRKSFRHSSGFSHPIIKSKSPNSTNSQHNCFHG